MKRAQDDDILARLKQQRQRLNERVQKIQSRQKKQQRAEDTRQKVLLGAFLRTWMDRDDDMRRRVMTGLDRYLTRDIDRVHFDLELRDDGTLKKLNPKEVESDAGVKLKTASDNSTPRAKAG